MSEKRDIREVLVRLLACGVAGCVLGLPATLIAISALVRRGRPPGSVLLEVACFEIVLATLATLIPLPTLLLATPRRDDEPPGREKLAAALCGIATAFAGLIAIAQCIYILCVLEDGVLQTGPAGPIQKIARGMGLLLKDAGMCGSLIASFVVAALSAGGFAYVRRQETAGAVHGCTAIALSLTGAILANVVARAVLGAFVPSKTISYAVIDIAALTPLGVWLVLAIADLLFGVVRRFRPAKTLSDP
jgi:hypothetical protein